MDSPATIWVGQVPGEYGGPAETEVSFEERDHFTKYTREDGLLVDVLRDLTDCANQMYEDDWRGADDAPDAIRYRAAIDRAEDFLRGAG